MSEPKDAGTPEPSAEMLEPEETRDFPERIYAYVAFMEGEVYATSGTNREPTDVEYLRADAARILVADEPRLLTYQREGEPEVVIYGPPDSELAAHLYVALSEYFDLRSLRGAP